MCKISQRTVEMSPGGVYNAVVAIPENEGGRAMQKYDVVVVGAGNGGLAAAACLAKAGKR